MVLVAAIAAAPVFADDGQHRHDGDRGRGRQEAQSAPRSEQAVPRAVAPQAYRDRRDNVAVPRYNNSARNYDIVVGTTTTTTFVTTPIHGRTTQRADIRGR